MKNNSSTSNSNISHEIINGDKFFKISNHDAMRPFFMSIVSSSNHWMFISSNGGLSAGRQNAQSALFPYYTDDKITEFAETTGSKTILLVHHADEKKRWEPFSIRDEGKYDSTRILYKSVFGNKLIFEEINHDLGLAFRYEWNTSDQFGFIRNSSLRNLGSDLIQISILDGLQNILPDGVGSDLQNSTSNLVDAYKRSELVFESGLGIFALSAIIVDKAEPSEALKANIAWSYGLEKPLHLLSSKQLTNFREGNALEEEADVKAEKGAYLLNTKMSLAAEEIKEWSIVLDVNKSQSDIVALSAAIKTTENIDLLVKKDIDQGTSELVELNASADGLQLSADKYRDARHFANTLFNIMRGGIFDDHYQIEKADLKNYLQKANKTVFNQSQNWIGELSDIFSVQVLKKHLEASENIDLFRLCVEYLPLKFSRRHGDPSRPWNKFSINTKDENDGSKILDYEGNWRDIFQNWEVLAISYPAFVEGMIHKFLNATTFDGYNPYRVTKGGFDWETIEPDDPWSYIGYWGDHQIIYLLKFLEFIEKVNPGKLIELFSKEIFVYANVPYRIKGYDQVLKTPKETIDFDAAVDHVIRKKRDALGADGALLSNQKNEIHHVNLIEKLMATLLAKISNFIPEGGIWMNTQRPEWNDANNALVGNGVSMVTLYYLRRFLHFFHQILKGQGSQKVQVSKEMAHFFESVQQVFHSNKDNLDGAFDDHQRKTALDEWGKAASEYRNIIYADSFSGVKVEISLTSLISFSQQVNQYLEHSIRANKRSDGLYHAYNLMTVESEDEISIAHLSEMLEGQVAVLSAGYLSSEEALNVLDALKSSALFRTDQYSYVLYPNKNLPGFLEKNHIPNELVDKSKLLTQLLADDNIEIIEKNINGVYHFNGNFHNVNDLNSALDKLFNTDYKVLIKEERKLLQNIFEQVFNHKAFTGRSGTFYGYEGLGSIYWHMVSKLLLAVQENCFKAIEEKASEEIIGRLMEHYYEINEGIGVHKPPSLYGAFPTDPYSHTPAGKGAQQPGMTGQVKEDILCRFGELGVFVVDGKLKINPVLLRKSEFLKEPQEFAYIDMLGNEQHLEINAGELCFTYCQVPIVYQISDRRSLEIYFEDEKRDTLKIADNTIFDLSISNEIFSRSGVIRKVIVQLDETILR